MPPTPMIGSAPASSRRNARDHFGRALGQRSAAQATRLLRQRMLSTPVAGNRRVRRDHAVEVILREHARELSICAGVEVRRDLHRDRQCLAVLWRASPAPPSARRERGMASSACRSRRPLVLGDEMLTAT